MSVDSVDITSGSAKTPPTLSLDSATVDGSNVILSGQAVATTPDAVIDMINIDWGEGSGFSESKSFPVTHLYQSPGR